MNVRQRQLAHDLRTPLNHLVGYCELLLESGPGDVPDAVETELRLVRELARSMTARIRSFFDQPTASLDRQALLRSAEDELARLGASCGRLADLMPTLSVAGSAADVLAVLESARTFDAMLRTPWSLTPEFEGVHALPSATAPAAPREASGRILVVDDDATNRDLLVRWLTREGHEVEAVADGRSALRCLEGNRFDLLLLDVVMPDMDGYAVLEAVRAKPQAAGVPVLMISAVEEVETIARFLDLGAEDYLPKPVESALLRARTRACLERKRLRDAQVDLLQQLSQWNQQLESRVSEQVAQLQRMERLKRLLPHPLAEMLVAEGGDDPLEIRRREVTIVFVDLRGFTAFAETAEPEEIMGVLREYHALVGGIVHRHGGIVEHFAGDGIMVIFNAPMLLADHVRCAARAALAVRTGLADVVRRWRALGFDLGVGIGIAHGYATVGEIGFEGRWDYGAIGSVTNLASRLCSRAGPGQILVAGRVALALGEGFSLDPLGPWQLDGFSRIVEVHALAAGPSEDHGAARL
jgi:class 3 adenylate cyclase